MVDLASQMKVYTGARQDLWPYIPHGSGCILDVGCATGEVGYALKARGKASKVVGLELNPDAASVARERLDAVHVGDVESLNLPYPNGSFDLLLYADVLEHLRNPWALLERHRGLLRTGGLVVASLPNIAHYSTITMLLRKQWKYEQSGIMDSTHLRFFTRATLQDLFQRAGYVNIRIHRHGVDGPRTRIVRALSLGYATDFLIRGFYCIGENP
jgi:SAM-dependent methyltransferase